MTFIEFARGVIHDRDYTNEELKKTNPYSLASHAGDEIIYFGICGFQNKILGSRFYIRHDGDNKFSISTPHGWSNLNYKGVGMILLHHFNMLFELSKIEFENDNVSI